MLNSEAAVSFQNIAGLLVSNPNASAIGYKEKQCNQIMRKGGRLRRQKVRYLGSLGTITHLLLFSGILLMFGTMLFKCF